MKDVVSKIEEARAQGVDVTADVYPYTASANGLDASLPDWVHDGGVDAMVARLRDPAQRERIARETGRELLADDILLPSCVNAGLGKYMGKRLSGGGAEVGGSAA